MPIRKALLVLTAVLFFGWMAYLIHLALTHRHSRDEVTVLSRPQFLVSQLVVVTHFENKADLEKPITVEKPLFQGKELTGYRVPDQITVVDLNRCKWSGPGDYLLPLDRVHDDDFMVTPIPRSPGYSGNPANPVIYRWTAETKDQFDHLVKPEAAADP